jgi:hypothetical protein
MNANDGVAKIAENLARNCGYAVFPCREETRLFSNSKCKLRANSAVVADRPEQRAVLVRAVAGGLKVFVNEGLGARMQRQIPRLTALSGHLEIRHAFPRMLRILDLELAQLLAPQRVEQKGGEDCTVPLALDRVGLGCGEQLAGRP